jgi:hypothetical protein
MIRFQAKNTGILNRIASIFFLIPLASNASTFLFQGTLTVDDQHPGVFFTVNAAETVTVQSYGYAGGTVNSTVIPSGGFDPNAFVFDSAGDLYAAYNGSGCITGDDPVTGNCDDPHIQQSYAAGQYELVIVVSGNQPNDSFLGDGFVEDGSGSFTCAPFGESGNFCDGSTATGTQRTGDWAFAVTDADSASLPTPEPAGLAIWGIAGVAVLLMQRRRSWAAMQR